MQDYCFKDNKEESRYELELEDGQIAIINYHIMPRGEIALIYTKVPLEYSGRGIGSQIVKKSLEDIKNRETKVIPKCGFVASYIHRNPEWEDLVMSR